MYWLQYRRQAGQLDCRAVAVAPLLRYGQSRSRSGCPAPLAVLVAPTAGSTVHGRHPSPSLRSSTPRRSQRGAVIP